MTTKTKTMLEVILRSKFDELHNPWQQECAKEVITAAKELELTWLAEDMERDLF
jgi:hypothetical protein